MGWKMRAEVWRRLRPTFSRLDPYAVRLIKVGTAAKAASRAKPTNDKLREMGCAAIQKRSKELPAAAQPVSQLLEQL
jgi:hypothetical protein